MSGSFMLLINGNEQWVFCHFKLDWNCEIVKNVISALSFIIFKSPGVMLVC